MGKVIKKLGLWVILFNDEEEIIFEAIFGR